MRVRLGEWNASSTNEPFPVQESAVSAVFVHPGYISSNLFNDIAVLRLTTPINADISGNIGTICGPTPNMNFDNMRYFIILYKN